MLYIASSCQKAGPGLWKGVLIIYSAHNQFIPHRRPNAFQVISQDGQSKATLHGDDHTPNHLSNWVAAINDRIKETVLVEVR